MAGGGYAGKVLRVDLSNERFMEEALSKELAFLLLGGKGLGALLLYKGTEAGLNPLSPSNLLIFMTGPLTGTLAPSGCRFSVVTKSPATGAFLDSSCGGYFGPELKKAGYDGIVVEGKAEKPSILVIEDEEKWIQPAEKLWGFKTLEAEKEVKEKLGPSFRVALIGPAGERGAPIAGIFSDLRAAGRGGAGAVMGSKRLKAIAVKSSRAVEVYDPEGFRKASWTAHRMLRMHEVTARSLPIYGTVNILETVNETGALPTRNFQSGMFKEADRLSSYRWRGELWRNDKACFGCPIACCKVALVQEGPFKGAVSDGPDYETIWAFGPQCGVGDKEAVAYADQLCDLYGVDTISAGCIIGFVMELYERGIITERDVDGIEARWGSVEALVKLLEKICKGDGVGGLLQLGVKKISERYPGSERFAMHVKGLEMPGYEPRASQGMGLGYATSDRGACHLRAYTAGQEILGYGGAADPLNPQGKAQLVIDRQNEEAAIDSSGLCFFASFGVTFREFYKLIVACTGLPYKGPGELMKLGERVYNITRLFNAREGFGRKDDTLPRRMLEEPMPEGPAKGSVVKLEEMLKEYYILRGWSEEGVPTGWKLKELDIDKII